ncbi:4a-hydroxytetrahydrobiopterin dehydratase [Motilimonas sp. KMU-193]|uniref:4a-hydroxytetrahydrobiopterin dehydratase n=1 Tax=Motilimonas sp. KMU-193 TaxID=3388668 RepID=UPI00396B26E4
MKPLSQLRCQACQGDMHAMAESQQQSLMEQLPDWQRQSEQGGQRLVRVFRFNTYPEAANFTAQLAELAEQVQHHPMITLEWGKVTVVWWTHSLGALHLNDFIMAAQTDLLYQGNHI